MILEAPAREPMPCPSHHPMVLVPDTLGRAAACLQPGEIVCCAVSPDSSASMLWLAGRERMVGL